MKPKKRIKSLIYNEKYHNNCHDYLRMYYLERYAVKKYIPLLYEINEKIPKLNICTEMPIEYYANTIVCDQHAVIFGHHNDIYPILATYALNACIGLIMFSKEYGIGCIAHIDGLPGYSKESALEDGLNIDIDPVTENIKNILKYLRFLSGSNKIIHLDYYLVGGIFDLSEVMINDIINCINNIHDNNYILHLKGRNLLGPENQCRNISIDTRTGKIYYFDYLSNAEFYFTSESKTNKLPKNIIKAPRKSEIFLDITYVPIL